MATFIPLYTFYFNNTFHCSYKVSVLFVYPGVLMWEVFTEGRMPFEQHQNHEVVTLVTQGHRLYRPKMATVDIYDIMQQCWHEVREIICLFWSQNIGKKLMQFYIKYCEVSFSCQSPNNGWQCLFFTDSQFSLMLSFVWIRTKMFHFGIKHGNLWPVFYLCLQKPEERPSFANLCMMISDALECDTAVPNWWTYHLLSSSINSHVGP